MLCRQDMRGDWRWIYGNLEPGQCPAVHRAVTAWELGDIEIFRVLLDAEQRWIRLVYRHVRERIARGLFCDM